MHVTKALAVESQLSCAIRLFFRNEDPISIHTLIGAVDQLLIDIAAERGVTLFIQGMLVQAFPGPLLEKVQKEIRKPRNFFKHADKDPNDILPFYPQANGHSIFFVCESFVQLFPASCKAVNVFRNWFLMDFCKRNPVPEFYRSHLEKAQSLGVTDPSFEDLTKVLERP
jgi:hypothetical protein